MARLKFEKASVPDLPSAPGVYIFFDEKGKPVYVGKAGNLRSRVRSYFGSGDGSGQQSGAGRPFSGPLSPFSAIRGLVGRASRFFAPRTRWRRAPRSRAPSPPQSSTPPA